MTRDRTHTLARWWKRTLQWTARSASIAAGIYIEYLQVKAGEHASSTLVLLGLWFIVIPPAQWLDSLRRATAAAEKLRESPMPPDKEHD